MCINSLIGLKSSKAQNPYEVHYLDSLGRVSSEMEAVSKYQFLKILLLTFAS